MARRLKITVDDRHAVEIALESTDGPVLLCLGVPYREGENSLTVSHAVRVGRSGSLSFAELKDETELVGFLELKIDNG